MSSYNNTASVAPKSKHERIRDNQRRSRARRQEYLAELERQVRQCHIICREANLQRAAITGLEAENSRLRDLLKSAGINPDGQKDAPQHSADIVTSSFRQILPKLRAPKMTDSLPALQQGSRSPTYHSISSDPLCCSLHRPVSAEDAEDFRDPRPNQIMTLATTPAMTTFSVTNAFPRTSPDRQKANTSQENAFICDTIQVPSNESPPDDRKSVQDSVTEAVEHPDTLTSMDNTAPTYINQNGCQEAEQLYTQVMETSRRVLGAEHASTIAVMGYLASMYRSQGRWKEAEELDMKVMDASKTVLGAEDL